MKTRFDNREIQNILQDYDLGILQNSKEFKEGAVQTNILLQTTKGKYVLRYYENRSKEYVLFEVDILHYFHERKYPCALPIRNIHGSFIGNLYEKPYSIFEYIEGKHIKKPNSQQYKELVKYLAKLHNLSKGYRPRYWEFRQSHDKQYCWDTSKIEAKRFGSKSKAKERLNWLKNELNKLSFPNSIPKGVVHCDYDIANIKFKGNKLSGVLDFDDACYTYLIYDIASLIYYWCWVRVGKLNFQKARNLLKNYSRYRKLSYAEKQHIFDALKMVSLTYVTWFFYEKYKGKDILKKSKLELNELDQIGKEEFYNRLFD